MHPAKTPYGSHTGGQSAREAAEKRHPKKITRQPMARSENIEFSLFGNFRNKRSPGNRGLGTYGKYGKYGKFGKFG